MNEYCINVCIEKTQEQKYNKLKTNSCVRFSFLN